MSLDRGFAESDKQFEEPHDLLEFPANVRAGVYFYRLITEKGSAMGRGVLLR
jgi:hypothetical protein